MNLKTETPIMGCVPEIPMSGEKLVFGAILGFVGGLVILVYGAYEVYLGMTMQSIANLAGLPVTDIAGVVYGGTAGIVLGILIMILSVALAEYSDHCLALGGLLIACSLLSLVSFGGGNGVGFLLGVVGGACGIAFGSEEWLPGPEHPLAPSLPAPPGSGLGSSATTSATGAEAPSSPLASQVSLYRGCANCGKICSTTLTVCPLCGEKL
jgi:hypothetical protein